jgi:serine-type D-Ala-D-Ala endopeptidase (penicillin-binding protein 7)
MKSFFLPVFAALIFGASAAQVSASASLVPDPAKLRLASANVLVVDAGSDQPLYAKGANEVTAIASLTKLMTALVTIEGGQPLDEPIEVDLGDFDYLKGSRSRLSMGAQLPRREMLRLALMSSENRAASSLARHYPGGTDAFVAAMNAKAEQLGMTRTRFADPTGLSPQNVSTAHDLARLVRATAQYPLIREYSTTPSHFVEIPSTGRLLGFNNSNRLVASGAWDIQLQKTGYIREAGRCLVMLANVAGRQAIIVLLDSSGKYTRLGDAQRVKHWLETGESLATPVVYRAPPGARKAMVRQVSTGSVGKAKRAPKARAASVVAKAKAKTKAKATPVSARKAKKPAARTAQRSGARPGA